MASSSSSEQFVTRLLVFDEVEDAVRVDAFNRVSVASLAFDSAIPTHPRDLSHYSVELPN